MVRLVDFILGCLLLGVRASRESLVLALTEFLDKDIFPLLANNDVSVDDFFNEASLILEFAKIGIVYT